MPRPRKDKTAPVPAPVPAPIHRSPFRFPFAMTRWETQSCHFPCVFNRVLGGLGDPSTPFWSGSILRSWGVGIEERKSSQHVFVIETRPRPDPTITSHRSLHQEDSRQPRLSHPPGSPRLTA